MKLPYIQFYPADWRKDPGIQALSFHDRGVWFEILCLMHESEQRGILLLNGKPMPEDALARLLGLDKQNLTKCVTTLIEYGVVSIAENGALMNRRMVRDEELRKIRQEAGKLGGNPALLNQKDKQNSTKTQKGLNQKSTLSETETETETEIKNNNSNARAREPAAVADDSKGQNSRFTIEVYREYADYLSKTRGNITNPGGLARTLFDTGASDGDIQKWLDSGKGEKPKEVEISPVDPAIKAAMDKRRAAERERAERKRLEAKAT